MRLNWITMFMCFVFVRSEIAITVTSNSLNHVSLLQYGDFLNDKHLMFEVKGVKNAHVELLFSQTLYYTIKIGGWGNTWSTLQKSTNSKMAAHPHFENGIISNDVYRKFWISWNKGHIQVGKGNIVNQGMFLEIEDQCLYALKDIKLSTGVDATVKWLIQPPSERASKNDQMITLFQEIRNCSSLQLLNTFKTPSAIKCGLQCLGINGSKGFRFVKRKGECEILSDEEGNDSFLGVYIMRD